MTARILARVLACTTLAISAFGAFGAALGQTIEAVDRTALRVCADPNNLPFSNEKGEGFENKIAEIFATELNIPVRYAYYPQATGFLRNTLRARRCDVVMGMPTGSAAVLSTNPYYRSTYALVSRADRRIPIDRLNDPKLKDMRIGVTAGSPPTTILAQNGLLNRIQTYALMVDTRYEAPSQKMIEDVLSGVVDLGILWGPIAGYYAKQYDPQLTVVPLIKEPRQVRLNFWIAMGVRPEETQWKHQLNDLIKRKQADIDRVLKEYGVVRLNRQGQPIP
jgi:quinoprotein dehydrogenase-associated probable ABC transporter substrate-binding protein